MTYSVRLLQSLIKAGLIDKEAILEHHENLDGTGYPKGMTWESISLSGRILHITKEAMDELYRCGDMMYDSDLVDLLAFYFSPTSVPAYKKGAINYL
jgi:response regulator RpfG family c-di-GMP phosphodiesterase